MTRAEALRKLHGIMQGVDANELESDEGWWPNSVGAEFGTKKLAALESLVTQLTSE